MGGHHELDLWWRSFVAMLTAARSQAPAEPTKARECARQNFGRTNEESQLKLLSEEQTTGIHGQRNPTALTSCRDGPFGSIQYALFDPLVDHNEDGPVPGLAHPKKWLPTGHLDLQTTRRVSSMTAPANAGSREVHDRTNSRREDRSDAAIIYTVIKSVEAPDPLTVKMVTDGPFPDLPFAYGPVGFHRQSYSGQ